MQGAGDTQVVTDIGINDIEAIGDFCRTCDVKVLNNVEIIEEFRRPLLVYRKQVRARLMAHDAQVIAASGVDANKELSLAATGVACSSLLGEPYAGVLGRRSVNGNVGVLSYISKPCNRVVRQVG